MLPARPPDGCTAGTHESWDCHCHFAQPDSLPLHHNEAHTTPPKPKHKNYCGVHTAAGWCMFTHATSAQCAQPTLAPSTARVKRDMAADTASMHNTHAFSRQHKPRLTIPGMLCCTVLHTQQVAPPLVPPPTLFQRPSCSLYFS